MSKYMVVEGVTFKKTDLKRIERVNGQPRAYAFVTGMKTPIMMNAKSSQYIQHRIVATIQEAEEK